ncbi:hypothetical protein JCM11641_003830, partial [Rhodosporidiobolus odoratus]
TYMSTLARDMGAAPSLFPLLREHGLFITFVYCFSAAFTSHYRLLGPFRDPKAPEVVRTEIWDTVKRRGVLGNLFMGAIPMLFYALVNLTALLLELTWIAVGKPDVLGAYKRVTGKTCPLARLEVERELKVKRGREEMKARGLPN